MPTSAENPSSAAQYFPDEVAVALCLYGLTLQPVEITRLLGVEPTHAHLAGDREDWRSPPHAKGAWIREVRKFEPIDPDAMFEELFRALPEEERVWQELASQFEVEVHFAVHTDVGCTFNLSPRTVQLIAARSAALKLYIQAYGDNAA